MKTYVYLTRFQNLLYYFAKFIGLAPFSVKNNNLHPFGFLGKAYAVILIVLIIIWTYFARFFYKPRDLQVSQVNQIGFVIRLILFVINTCVSLFIFAFNSNKIIDITKKIIRIKSEVKYLGIEDGFRNNWNKLYLRIIGTNSAVILMKVIIENNHDYGYHDSENYNTMFEIFYWIGNLVITMRRHSVILIFAETMNSMKQHFETLNNKLQGTVPPSRYSLLSDDQHNSSVFRAGGNRRIADQAARRFNSETDDIQLSVEDVEKIEKVHRELCDLVESTTQFYTLPILLTISEHFSSVLLICYSTYLHVFILHDAFETTDAFLSFIQPLVTRAMIMMLDLFLIANASTSICRVGNAAKAILHKVWNKFYPEELTDQFIKFSLQLLHKRVAVRAFGFFDLGYSFLYKIFCAMVAYFIIMIQFDKSSADPAS